MDTTMPQSILQSSEPSLTSFSSNESMFDGLKEINLTTWFVIVLLLAFLGFNIFAYLAQGTQSIADVLAPLVGNLFGTTVAVTGQAVDVSAEGAKAVVGRTADAIDTALTAVQDATPNAGQTLSTIPPQGDQSTLNRALNTAQSKQSAQHDYEAHDASSSLKSGWCYIGEDRGYRSCAQVGANDTCMSGDIFPSHEICMNPSLRA